MENIDLKWFVKEEETNFSGNLTGKVLSILILNNYCPRHLN